MAAMTIEPRDPEMSHFIDQYKFERQMAERRDKFGGGTSLPLNSDGYEDRQRFLKEERHREWAEHQERLRSLQEHKPQQRKIEQERIEQRRRNRPPPAQPQTNQIDYNEARELANTEDRRAYQDYQGKITMPIEGRAHIKPPISYEENRKVLAEERKHEYALYQEKKAKEERYRAMRGRPITPPGGGLDVGQYDRQVKETKAQKTKEYRDMLDQQQKEQMMLRAQRDTEMSVIDRQRMSDSQYVASKPPAGPAFKQRDEPIRQPPGFWNEGRRAASPKSVHSEAHRRQRDDGVPLEDERRRQLSNRTVPKPAAVVKGPYYSSDNYETYQAELRRKQIDDYKEYLQKRPPPPSKEIEITSAEDSGLPIGQQHHEAWRKFLRGQRNKEYNQLVEKTRPAPKNRGWKESDSGLLLPEDHSMEYKKRELQNERKKEYQEHLAQQRKNEVPRRDDYGRNVEGPYNGMFHGLGEHGGNKDELSQQRRQEYNDRLDQQYSQREKPTGRPSWAKDPVTDQEFGDRGRSPLKSPTKQDHYEQMLHEKRREEAQRRRYDDPEYQEKLARMDSRERGPARDQPRYGY